MLSYGPINHSYAHGQLMRQNRLQLLILAALLASVLMAGFEAGADDGMAAALALFQKKNYNAATKAFWPLTFSSRGATASYYLALCYIQSGMNDEARVMFERIVKRWPDSPEAKLSAQYLQVPSTQPVLAKDVQGAAATAGTQPATQAHGPAGGDLYSAISKSDWDALPERSRIPVEREMGHLFVKAKVNGRYCKMIFDTGAAVCCISSLDYPDLFSAEQLASAQRAVAGRVYGPVPVKVLTTEITLQDITRKVRVMVIPEKGCSLIGQNFFREYSYQVDDFYLRLTKAPYSSTASIPAAVSAVRTVDKYTVAYEVEQNCMYVQALVNRRPTRVQFDTGCAPDGIVINPSMRGLFDVRDNRIERLEFGPVIRMGVPVYYASGISVPLIGPKIFNRPYTVDPSKRLIKFDY